MKHKILIALDAHELKPVLFADLRHFLNSTETNLLTGIFLPDYFEKKSGNTIQKRPENLVSKVAFEIGMEHEAASFDMEFEMFKGTLDDEMLRSLSTVADLMIVDQKVLQKYGGEDMLRDLLKFVSCPVLVLPRGMKIESLVMVHDGTVSSVQAVKHFLHLFNPSFRTLPLSVLVSGPSSKNDIQNEKVFIEYLKLFFKDIGIQLMDDEPVHCLVKSVEAASEKPLLLIGGGRGNQIFCCDTGRKAVTDSTPTFIFKG